MKLLLTLVLFFVLYLIKVESADSNKFLFPPGFDADKKLDQVKRLRRLANWPPTSAPRKLFFEFPCFCYQQLFMIAKYASSEITVLIGRMSHR